MLTSIFVGQIHAFEEDVNGRRPLLDAVGQGEIDQKVAAGSQFIHRELALRCGIDAFETGTEGTAFQHQGTGKVKGRDAWQRETCLGVTRVDYICTQLQVKVVLLHRLVSGDGMQQVESGLQFGADEFGIRGLVQQFVVALAIDHMHDARWKLADEVAVAIVITAH